MSNVVLNKTSGSSGQIVVQVIPEAYIGKNDATKEVIFTNAKGTTATLTCLFKGTGEYIYDNPVITEVTAPNFPAGGGTKQLQFKGYQIYRETSDGDEVGRLKFTQDTVADGFNKHMENINALSSDVTLDKKIVQQLLKVKELMFQKKALNLVLIFLLIIMENLQLNKMFIGNKMLIMSFLLRL